MEGLFIRALNVSIAASFLVLTIILYRLFAKRAPKWASVLLWGLVGLRLLLPFDIESAWSLIPSKNTIPTTITHDRYPTLDTGFEGVDEIVNPILSGRAEARPEYSSNPMQTLITILGWIWLALMLCMLIYMAVSFTHLRIKTRVNAEREDNVYLCDYVKTPFILGIIRPRIYLPSDISDKDYSLVVAHERAHMRRLDHIWKPLGFLLLSVYWFNPLLWVAYVLLCRDIESACDEKVISELDGNGKAAYSEALLSLGIKSRVICACPLAFGEVSVKSRVSAISRYKKPAAAVIAVSLVVCTVFAVCFLTYKKNNTVAIDQGIWYAGKVIGATDINTACEDVPRFVFTENGDILVQSNNLADLSYVNLGKRHTAYISENEYEKLFEEITFREGYDAKHFHDNVKVAWRITPSVSSGIQHEEVYLLRSENELYVGFADDGKIPAVYELKFNETLPTYLYTVRYAADNAIASIILDTSSGMARITFGSNLNYEAFCTHKYENSKLILTTKDYFELKLVFIDVGGALVFSEKDSDTKGFEDLLSDGTSFHGYYQLYGATSCTEWYDVNGDGDFNSYKYLVTYDGNNLLFTPEE